MKRAAERFRFNRVEAHEVEAFRRLGSRQILTRLGLPLWKTPFVARFLRQEMAQSPSAIALFDGVDRVFEALHADGIAIAIVTSNSRDNVQQILGAENTLRVSHFECSVSTFGKRKRLRKLLKATCLTPSEVLFVGDEIRDAEAARAEGIDFVGVSWGYAAPEALTPFSSTR